MSVFLQILRCILCCDDEFRHGDYGTSRGEHPLHQSASYETSVRSSSAHSHNDLLRQSDPTKIYYHEYYPNLSSISKSTRKEPDVVSFESEYNNKPLRNASEVSQSVSCSTKLPQSSAKKISSSSNPSPSSSKLSYSNSATYSSKPTSLPANVSSSFTQSSSFSKPPSSSLKSSVSSTGVPPSSSSTSSSLAKPAIYTSSPKSSSSSLIQSVSLPEARPFASDQPLSSAKQPACSFKQSASLSEASPSSRDLSQSSSGLPPSSLKTPPPSKPTLSSLPSVSSNRQKKANYIWVQNGTSPIYMIPKDIEDLIKKDVVPSILKKPLSPTTYKDYFAALLYAEDFYIEKWSGFQLFNVTVELHEAAIYNKSLKNKDRNLQKTDEKDDKVFVAFEIDSVPERRPFLLSRDFVYARRVGGKTKFQGLIYRVVKSNIVLVEFEKAFYFQHRSDRKYDISFSFNRVCLKRAHQAIAAASGPLFQNYLFPDCASGKNDLASATPFHCNCKLDLDQISPISQILSFQGSPPYVVEGPLSVTGKQLSKTGIVVREAVLEIYQSSAKNRILICAPINKTCDVIMASLKKEIPESDMFRANAAFREIDGVPTDILPLCLFKGECFSCPSLQKLRRFRVIFSTFVSSFRLHNEGVSAGHFSHIFLVDASSAIEPETMIPLGYFSNERTSVIVTGAPRNHSSWVRSDIARKNGLRVSYFERLCRNNAYMSFDRKFTSLQNS